jgi:hypothetical protein
MHHAQLIDYVRKLIADHFAALGRDLSDGLHETILIRQGYYCGRRFSLNGCQAIWFIEEKEIKFYDQQGGVVKTVAIDLEQAQSHLAAA